MKFRYVKAKFHFTILKRLFALATLYFHLCSSMEAWLRGTNFDKTLQFTDCDEGEVVRYFRMSVQVLREIAQAPVASYLLKDKIKETIRVLNRDIVDAEKQLREG